MNYLWSPWRMDYITNNKNASDCVFCLAMDMSDGYENLIVHRDHHNYVILNRFPYTSGHIMIVPFEHSASLEQIKPEARAEMMELCVKSIRILADEYKPEGFNIGLNIGQAAGAGIIDHVHLHIVPRWGGDTNFMTALGEVRVLPEALEDTYKRMKKGWEGGILS